MGDLDQDYAIQQKLFDENVKYCTEELAALADAIKESFTDEIKFANKEVALIETSNDDDSEGAPNPAA